MPRPIAPAGVLGLLVAVCCAGTALAYPQSFPPVPKNPADKFSSPIDELRYDRSRGCVKRPTKGGLALQSWLEASIRGESWGIMRCAKLSPTSYSLHAEGRAIDWHLEIGDREDRRAAIGLVSLLLATDKRGNDHALARRMGVQEVIWDCKIWWPGLEGMTRYSACATAKGKLRRKVDPSTAHRNHVHIGLNRSGAAARTSFWR